MTDKGLGFIRNINLAWLDAAADSRLRNDDIQIMREELNEFLKHEMKGIESRRKTIDVLVGIWHKTALVDNSIHSQALDLLPRIPINERIWLHYGLTLLSYPFFRQTAAVIGQFARTGEPIARPAIKNRLANEIGHLGSLNRAAERIVASLVDWGCLKHEKKGNIYIPLLQSLITDSPQLQTWLLTCSLYSHPASQLPFPDLIRLPELFPFKFTISVDNFRRDDRLSVQKQGMWDMVGIVRPSS